MDGNKTGLDKIDLQLRQMKQFVEALCTAEFYRHLGLRCQCDSGPARQHRSNLMGGEWH